MGRGVRKCVKVYKVTPPNRNNIYKRGKDNNLWLKYIAIVLFLRVARYVI